jgi:hypothetical protein
MMDDDRWIERWETGIGVAPRLSTFFSSPEAQMVLREFKSYGNTKGDVEVLGFLLIFYVWPETDRKTGRPPPQVLNATARCLEQCRRRIMALDGTGLLEGPEAVQRTCDQLQQWATHLTLKARGWPMIPMGRFWIGTIPPAAKRHRAKRQVISFLTAYFHALGCAVPPWRMITQFLILTTLAPPTGTEKHIATWWSNVTRREYRTAGAEPLAPYQDDQFKMVEHFKNHVWSGS